MSDPATELALLRAALAAAEARASAAETELSTTKVQLAQHRAVVSTSGSANAATGPAGDADQLAVAEAVARAIGGRAEEVLCLSTGVIGVRLPVPVVLDGIAALASRLAADDASLEAAARALMTTDTTVKLATTTVAIEDPDGLSAHPIRVSGVAKGVGMIHPRMATMLAVMLTDAAVEPALLGTMLRRGGRRP